MILLYLPLALRCPLMERGVSTLGKRLDGISSPTIVLITGTSSIAGENISTRQKDLVKLGNEMTNVIQNGLIKAL